MTSTSGVPSTDINFQTVKKGEASAPNVYQGSINITEETNSDRVVVSYVTPIIPSSIQVPANGQSTNYFVTAYR